MPIVVGFWERNLIKLKVFFFFGRKNNIKAEGFLVCVCASDEALYFFEAFLAFLASFLAALIGLHFQVKNILPLETHFATILLFIIVAIVHSIAYMEIKLQPQGTENLPIFKFICLVSGIIAIELLVSIIISLFWLFMVNLCQILIVRVLLVPTNLSMSLRQS